MKVWLTREQRGELYWVACDFIGPLPPERAVLHALYSSIGLFGASFAAYYRRDHQGLYRLDTMRGEAAALPPKLDIARKRLVAFEPPPGALTEATFGLLGAEFRRAARRARFELVAALPGGGAPVGLLVLGPRLLGEPQPEQVASLLHGLAALLALALGVDADEGDLPATTPSPPLLTPPQLRVRCPALARYVGDSPALRLLFDRLQDIAPYDHSVLIQGPTGAGKELVARSLHELGPRRAGPFEAVNCATFPKDLTETMLFGHEKGAFTGAVEQVIGLFEQAADGTLFLDEIGEMPLDLQAKLLTALSSRVFKRVMGRTPVPVRAGVIAATNRDLKQEVAAGRFRQDLYYRLCVLPVRVPALAERREDLEPLAADLIRRIVRKGARIPRLSREALELLQRHPFPGNVNQLEHVLLHAVVSVRGGRIIEVEHLPPDFHEDLEPTAGPDDVPAGAEWGHPMGRLSKTDLARLVLHPGDPPNFRDIQRAYVRAMLKLTGGNKAAAARLMAINRNTFMALLKRLELT